MSSDERHLTAEALDRYRRRTAPAEELLATDAHIAACDRCYAEVRAQAGVVELPESHLSYEELEAYADARADAIERELVEAHVAVCTRCGNDLADLLAARDDLGPRPPRALHQFRLPRPRT